MDLTADQWISSGGNAWNAREMQNLKNVDELIRRIGSFSIGYTSKPDEYQNMIRMADKAMYRAKADGKNRAACLD